MAVNKINEKFYNYQEKVKLKKRDVNASQNIALKANKGNSVNLNIIKVMKSVLALYIPMFFYG